MLLEVFRKFRFWATADRIGPDMPLNHWMLHFPTTMKRLCRGKFLAFGENAEFRAGAYAISCSNISIGKNVVIRPTTLLMADDTATIVIEDNVLIGMGVHVYVNSHRFDRTDVPVSQQGYYPSRGVVIKEGAWLGANVIVLPGVVIGKNSVIGAGSVVTRSVPDYSMHRRLARGKTVSLLPTE
jgi:acetyltransferase-like isoleucine patch superfamily enzyme